jgi:hypothetical protein
MKWSIDFSSIKHKLSTKRTLTELKTSIPSISATC